MRLLFCFFTLFVGMQCFAQVKNVSPPSLPVYKQFPTVPPFALYSVPDSILFSKKDLKKNKATIIFVFSPDCDHCQHATEDLIKNYEALKKVQIVMATSLDYPTIAPFYAVNKLERFKNISMGWDKNRFLSNFYGISSFPSVYVYDKKGNFVQGYEGNVSFEAVGKLLK